MTERIYHLADGRVATNGNQAEAWTKMADYIRSNKEKWYAPDDMIRMCEEKAARYAALPPDEPMKGQKSDGQE